MPTFVFVGVEELIAPAFTIFKFKFEDFEKVHYTSRKSASGDTRIRYLINEFH
jgi:hypothetical protein